MPIPTDDAEIQSNYTTPPNPIAFSGINRVQDYYRISEDKARDALSKVDSYTLHREYKKPRHRNPYYIYRRRQQVQADLIDFRSYKQFNNGHQYILCVIDCFSRKLWVRSLTNKSAQTTADAMREILKEMGDDDLPETIFCDRGTELKNVIMKQLLREKSIKMMHPSSEIKAGIVERVNRTLQRMLHQQMSENQTKNWVFSLYDVKNSYNSRPHRSIDKLSPNAADMPRNADRVATALRKHYAKAISPNFDYNRIRVGNHVRVKNRYGNRFARGYEQQFSDEIYTVTDINRRMGVPMYKLVSDDTGEEILGGWYIGELQLVGNADVFRVEKVLKRRRRKGVVEIFVKWIGFGDRHNSWIKDSDIARIY
jgi:transposase InsO family protein